MRFLLIIVLIGMICSACILMLLMYKKKKKIKEIPKKEEVDMDCFNKKQIENNPVYVIDHSKEYPNKYVKGDRDMMKRIFNQNSTVTINSISNQSQDKSIASNKK
ncbi:hypothetical protein CN895_07660 [Bacillus cereus]|uniref:hypothetical protein n=1 Tax=Bacillus cereus TaxID=1396 RepID=UPI000BFD5D88|nr:hypothetical protein [Bacillus cereus]PGK15217.1 hypothetical protein CN895_07660 [Bacillus cereus]